MKSWDDEEGAGMKRFKYGLCEWSVNVRGKKLCQMAEENGLDCLQLGVGEEVFSGKGLGNPALVEEYQAEAAEHGIEIESLAPQFVDQYSFTRPKGKQEEETAIFLVDKTIELCEIFGCRSFLLPVLEKNGIFDGASFHRAAGYIKSFSQKAWEKGIETYLEVNLSAEEVRNLLDAVDHPGVKLYFDSQNLYARNGTSMGRYFTELSDVIGGVHLKDGVGSMLSGSLLGQGTSGFQRTARAILDSNYSGSLVIESVYGKPTVCGLGPQEELLARDVKTLRETFE